MLHPLLRISESFVSGIQLGGQSFTPTVIGMGRATALRVGAMEALFIERDCPGEAENREEIHLVS